MKIESRFRSAGSALLVAALIHLCAGTALPSEAAVDTPSSAESSESSGIDAEFVGASVLDVLIVRPLGLGASAVGLAFFVVSVPFVALSGDFETSWDVFVVGPVEYTFERPVGAI